MMILGSTLAVSAVGIGGTLALFTAEATVREEFTAGRFCFTSERNDGDTTPGPMFYITAHQGRTPDNLPGIYPTGLWAPGDTHARTLTISNPRSCSSMNGWLIGASAELAAGSDAALAEKLWVQVITVESGVDKLVGEAYLSDFLAGTVPLAYPSGAKVPMYLTSNRHMKFRVSFDHDAGNQYQDLTTVVHFHVHGQQMANNP